MIEDIERVRWCSQNIFEYQEARDRLMLVMAIVTVGITIHYSMTPNAYIQNCRNHLEIAAEAGTVELEKRR